MALRNRELHARNDDDASPNMVDMTHFLLVAGARVDEQVAVERVIKSTALFLALLLQCELQVDDGVIVISRLMDLPDDIIYMLLKFCDVRAVGRLAQVCRRLSALISCDCVWLCVSRRLTCICGPGSTHWCVPACRLTHLLWSNF